MIYDVIVVGAGPAGSTAARECAARGLSVLVLDRATFPRDKPCGGGVNARTARVLPIDLSPVVERTIHGLHVSVRRERGFTQRSEQPLSYLTQRSRLDAYLLEAACRAGAVLREGVAVREVERAPGHVHVQSRRESFQGRTLVAADGANGPCTRLTGLRGPRWAGIALEGNVSCSHGWDDVFAVDIGSVPGGYGWLFPKGDHVNIGVGGSHRTGPALRSHLHTLTRFYGFEPHRLQGIRGHPLPIRRPGAPLAHQNVLLIGDAAGLLDPLTGEGIFSAVWSGMSAAPHLADFVSGRTADLTGYARQVELELGLELEAGIQLRDLFHARPGVWAGLLNRSPYVWQVVCRLLAGDQTYAGIKRKSRLAAGTIDAGADLVRAIVHAAGAARIEDTPEPSGALQYAAVLGRLMTAGKRPSFPAVLDRARS